jgi:hypothetical protein
MPLITNLKLEITPSETFNDEASDQYIKVLTIIPEEDFRKA